MRASTGKAYGIDLDDEGIDTNDSSRSSRGNTLINNAITKSDEGIGIGKFSNNNALTNNRFNGVGILMQDTVK